MISLGANDFQWALRAISEKGSKELVTKIEKLCGDNINYNWALTGACKGNNVDIIKYYLEKNPTTIDSALRLACENNCEDAVMLLSEKYSSFDTTLALAGACYSIGKIGLDNYSQYILNFLLANLQGTNIDCALFEASKAGLLDIIEKIIIYAKSSKLEINYVQIIRGATIGGYTNILKLYVKDDPYNIMAGKYEAAYHDNKDMISYYEQHYGSFI